MRKINKIVIHCADTPRGVEFDSLDIKKWHLERGFSDIGYHYVILLDGTIELGRCLKKQGAHARGVNKSSIGICYIGGKDETMTNSLDTRTEKQKESLLLLLKTLKKMFRTAEILGHYQAVETDKACPSFDAKNEYKNI
jgi:N-acetylmuramoyl-L-alanine amidase